MIASRFSLLIFLCAYWMSVESRHLDKERDFSTCPPNTIPIAIKNNDGFLKLTCIRPRCDEINKVKPVCSEAFTNGCTKGSWVGAIHREFKGANEKAEYKSKCCSHPIFSKTVSIKPQLDFWPGNEAQDGAMGQSDIIDIVTNVLANPQFDHHAIEVTSVSCQRSTTTTSTARPTRKPNSKEHKNTNNNGNNGAGGGGGGGGKNNGGKDGGHQGGGNSGGHDGGHGGDGGHNGGNGGHDGGHQGGNSGGHDGGHQGGSKEHGCGPTGCGQPKLEGGSETHYSKQNVPKPGNPPKSASDPKSWGIDTSPKGGGGAGCFSADTLVRTKTGSKRMDEIRVGDEILSSTSWDGNSASSYQPVTQFIHKDPTAVAQYTVISTASGRSLSLTPYHLLPHFDCQLLETELVKSVRQYELLFTQSAKFAKRARAGQCVLVVDEFTGELAPERITNVTRAVRRGVFSPITATGIIVANGVQASCYSSVENHALQHAFFTIMHKINRVCQPYLEYVANLFSSTQSTSPVQSHVDTQIPYLLRIMLALSDMVVASF